MEAGSQSHPADVENEGEEKAQHCIPQRGCEKAVWGEIATNNRLILHCSGQNTPSSLIRYQKHLTQQSANRGKKYPISLFINNPSSVEGQWFKRKNWLDEVLTLQMNYAFEEFLCRLLVSILLCQRTGRKKVRGECYPHAEVLKWRSVLKQNSLPKAHHSPVYCW